MVTVILDILDIIVSTTISVMVGGAAIMLLFVATAAIIEVTLLIAKMLVKISPERHREIVKRICFKIHDVVTTILSFLLIVGSLSMFGNLILSLLRG